MLLLFGTKKATAVFALLSALSYSSASAQVAPLLWAEPFSNPPGRWGTHGNSSLFQWDSEARNLGVTWNSAETNSYFYLPLHLTLTREDDFKIAFTLKFNQIGIGTTPGKPYTFQAAVGLLNLQQASDPLFLRGIGMGENGPRNLVEFNYFPDSGFGATVMPTVVTENNGFGWSANFPLEMETGKTYRIEMSFTGADATLRTLMWEDGVPFGTPPSNQLKEIALEPGQKFFVDAFAIASYSDEGQSPPEYAGSIHARGSIDDVEITVHNRPEVTVSKTQQNLQLRFQSNEGWNYFVESSLDLKAWAGDNLAIPGTGSLLTATQPLNGSWQFYRLRAERLP